MSALYDAVERGDAELVELLLERGSTPDEDAFYHACEQGDTAFLDLLYAPGHEHLVNHKLDFEDAAGLRWFLARGVDVDAHCCLHHAICRGRGVGILELLLDAGADVDLPWDRWDVGRRPLALAARCGHLAAYELLAARGATAELGPVDAAVLAVARGESVALPTAPPQSLGNPPGHDFGWILGQFALLGRTDVVAALLDAGMAVDTRGWSNFTPLDQAAMHGRTETVAYSLSAVPTSPTPPSTTSTRRRSTRRFGGCAITAPTTATIPGRSARWSPPARRRDSPHQRAMKRSTRC